MEAEHQSIAGAGCRHSKGELVRGYLLKRHGLCVDSIETIRVSSESRCEKSALHRRVSASFPCAPGGNVQNSVWNFDLHLYSGT